MGNADSAHISSETHAASERVVEIRRHHEGPDDLLDDCGHPRHASLHLKVTPISGCDGFVAAGLVAS
jgi:hypothetical protein